MARPRARSSRFEEIERLVRLFVLDGRRGRAPDRRRAARAPRASRRWSRCWPRSRALDDLSLTTNGYLLERMAADLAAAGLRRINVSLDSLSRDRFFQMTRRDSLPQVIARPRGARALSRSSRPIKVNCVAMRDFTEDEVLPFAELARRKPYQVRFIEFMPLDADHAWSEDRVLTGAEIRAMIDRGPPARAAAARAARDRARLPLPRRRGRDRLRQPGLGAVLRGLQPHPPDRRGQAAHLPVQPARDRPARAAARRAPTTTSSSRSIRDAVWRKELKHHVSEPGFRQPPRTMSQIGG